MNPRRVFRIVVISVLLAVVLLIALAIYVNWTINRYYFPNGDHHRHGPAGWPRGEVYFAKYVFLECGETSQADGAEVIESERGRSDAQPGDCPFRPVRETVPSEPASGGGLEERGRDRRGGDGKFDH